MKCRYCDFECETKEECGTHLNEKHTKCGICFKVVFDNNEFDDDLAICGTCRELEEE